MDKLEAKKRISQLIEKFESLETSGHIKQYNEAQTRNEFIEPLFEILGWDMRNFENEKEVTTEEAVSQGRVDLAFRINGVPVMFLEAKAAKVNLDEWKWAEQAINYSWNRGVTWAILSDFEGIKVFNAELPPQSIQNNLFFELNYKQYISDFDRLWLLSKESFQKSLLNQEGEKWGKLVLRKPVGEKLLESLIQWRDNLSSQFHAYNPSISIYNLDEGVQKLLDRLIFIRTTEDRKIEENILLTIKRNWESAGRKSDLFRDLNSIFIEFRKTYDSKLFEPHDFEIWDTPPAETLAKIIEELYKTNDGYRYDFSAIDSDVLGGIYEQYLGHVLQKAKKETIVEEKHAKRKSQGIFYTPSFIVNFIVKETLGKLLKEKNDNEIRNLKILDPACGSGSFLLKTYEELIRHYSANDKIFEKIRILTSNIYGVDLDQQAVEIARLNLLLQTVESKDLLPDLSNNIKIGNSLVTGDENNLKKYFGYKWSEQKPFNWEEEFPLVFKTGGFDLIIGNPPYIRNRELPDNLKRYFNDNYMSTQGQYDIYQLFFEQSIKFLKEGGLLGFITSNKYAITEYGKKLREYILENCNIKSIIDVSELRIFKDASTYPYIIILEKNKKNSGNIIEGFKVLEGDENFEKRKILINQDDIKSSTTKNFVIKNEPTFFKKIENNSVKLGAIAIIKETIHTGNIREKLIVDQVIDKNCKKLLAGKDCHRYWYKWTGKYIRYDKDLIERDKGEYANLVDSKYFENTKILLREIALKIECVFDDEKYFTLNKVYSIQLNESQKYNLNFVLALLNSRLLSFYFRSKFEEAHVQNGYLQFKKIYTSQIPIFEINFKDKLQKANHDKLADLALKMTKLNKELLVLSENSDKWYQLKDEIKKTDKKIDQMVYEIYGLGEREIKIVEESIK